MSADVPPFTLTTHRPEDTAAVGRRIGAMLEPGLVLGLIGPLGAGKTLLVKGIAAGNALDDVRRVTSPTFTLIHTYPGRVPLHHIDAYRLKSGAEFAALGVHELFEDAVVVEWADRIEPVLPPETITIHIEATGATARRLVFATDSQRGTDWIERLKAASFDLG